MGGQREPEFLAWVAILQAYNVQSYVELGTGHSHYIAAMGVPSVVAVDINTPKDKFLFDKGVRYIHGNSYDPHCLEEVLAILKGYPDVVFIDADHDGDAPQRDFDLWYPYAIKLVGFHDILIPNIERNIWPQIALRHKSAKIIGCDLASAIQWQGPLCPQDGIISGGGIGVVWK
jgi:hypothetical protein